MIRRWLALTAAVICTAAVAAPASAQVPSTGQWLAVCATGSTTSAVVEADQRHIDMSGTIAPCAAPPAGAKYAWIAYGASSGTALLFPYLVEDEITTAFRYWVGYGAVAVCLAKDPSLAGRLGCFGVTVAANGAVTATPIPTNSPLVIGKPVQVLPIDTTQPPNCATCV